MGEKVWYLKECNLFQRLDGEELARLESRCRARQFSRKAPVYLPADQGDAVLLLARGRVKICNLTADGRQAILAFVEPGEIFGELSILAEGEREEYAEAVEPSTAILIPGEEMRRLMDVYPDVTLGVTKLIGLRRMRIERRLKSLLYRTNRERLVHLLVELAEQYGRPAADGVHLGIKLSHQDLASIIGSTRETVTVVLGELQAEGKLRIGRRRIVLTDAQALAASVQRTLSLAGA